MSRKEFGQLVAALRQDLDWTQFQLAEYVDVDEAVIGQLERGVKKFFEPELLFGLANALQLTTLERREFFLAASGLDQKQIVRQRLKATATDIFNAERISYKMLELTASVRLPALLVDVYSDIIAANRIMLAFYNMMPSTLEDAAKVPGGYSTIWVNFGRDLIRRSQVANNWDFHALSSMRSFRANSLRYRTQPYFKYLMNAFRDWGEYPLFDRYWKMVSSTEEDKDMNMDHFKYEHSQFGPLNYLASSTMAVTPFGELILVQNIPLDETTDQIFDRLKSTAGQGIVRLAPWPIKPRV